MGVFTDLNKRFLHNTAYSIYIKTHSLLYSLYVLRQKIVSNAMWTDGCMPRRNPIDVMRSP